MTSEEVGNFRFCPACGRSSVKPEYGDSEDFESQECSCCDCPWIACPCTPASEGECRSEEKKGIKSNA